MRGFNRAGLVLLLVLTGVGSTLAIAQAGGPSSDLGISVADSPDPVTDGAIVRYHLTMDNAGPNATPLSVSFDLPQGGSIQVISSSAMGSCTGTATTGSCTSSNPLRPGRSSTIDVYVQAALPSPNALHAVATGANPDPNSENNEATEYTTVEPAGDTSNGFIPPGGGSITTCGSEDPSTDDNTCATLTATGGPGGPASIIEELEGLTKCGQVHCLGSDANVSPPPGYDKNNPLVLKLLYDVSELPSGNAKALWEKDGVDKLLRHCKGEPPRVFPCLQSKSRTIDGDYLFVILLTSIDPKFQGFVK